MGRYEKLDCSDAGRAAVVQISSGQQLRLNRLKIGNELNDVQSADRTRRRLPTSEKGRTVEKKDAGSHSRVHEIPARASAVAMRSGTLEASQSSPKLQLVTQGFACNDSLAK